MAVVRGPAVLATRETAERRGQSERLAAMAQAVLRESGHAAGGLDAVAVTTGPGSFTGLRAALSLAEGFSRAAGLPLYGLSVPEVLRAEWRDLAPDSDRALWVVVGSRPGRVFLWRGGDAPDGPTVCGLDALPLPEGPVALAGDAAAEVAARLRAGGADAVPTSIRRPSVAVLARLAAARRADAAAPGQVAPLYIDPPEAKPATGGRPPPWAVAEPLVAAAVSHAASMAAIHAIAFPPGQRWDAAAFATLLSGPGTFGWLDPDGGCVLARTAGGEAELLTLAVAPEARRRGRARALVAAAMRQAARSGAAAMFLEVHAGNAAARALYASLGFEIVGRRAAYYADGGDALVLRAAIAEAGAGLDEER